ncbi:MAG TPA: XkdF-like putative serine protease domain-containing protein [Bryobacteraceae bacterium]|nr:XkdF-like putative serine protease domain-containing protein [Bryobacteraceae bacterium]
MAGLKRQAVLKVQITKFSEEMGIIWGWASVADIFDLEGDVVPQNELVKAMYQFMQDYYAGAATLKENHSEEIPAVLVESTLQFIAGCVCWWVGVKLLTDDLREAARTGQISGFSIGGYAEMEEA